MDEKAKKEIEKSLEKDIEKKVEHDLKKEIKKEIKEEVKGEVKNQIKKEIQKDLKKENKDNKEEKNNKQNKKDKPKKKNFWKPIITVLIILIAIYMLTSAKVVNDAGCTEEVIVQEPVVKEIPYNTTEIYYEKTCGGDEFCKFSSYDFSTASKATLENIDGDIIYVCDITIINKENMTGNWSLHAVFRSGTTIVEESETQTKEVPGNEAVVFTFTTPWEEGKMISCERINDDIPVKKTDCVCSYYQNVKKYRTVTKIRNATVYEDVTKIVPSGECVDENGEPVIGVVFENRFFKYTQPFYFGY